MNINKITLREICEYKFGHGHYYIDDDVKLTYGLCKSLTSTRCELVLNSKHSNNTQITFDSD
jgi:hypothetical protein